MRVSDWTTYMLANPWDWGLHDCLTFVEKVANIQRPAWAQTQTEFEARKNARTWGNGSEWRSVVQFLDRLDGFQRINVVKPNVGDIALTPQYHWTYNDNRNKVEDGNNTWALGVIDDAYQFVAYCDGVIIRPTPVGIMWGRV